MDEDHAQAVAALPDGFVTQMGIRFVRATANEVVAELDVGERHKQPLGMVHGGVLSGLVETVTSIGAGINAIAIGKLSVGLENHTSFLHAVRGGTIRATARPLTRGSRTQVWEANVTDASDRLVASGRVRFLVLDPGASVGGEPVAIKDA